MLDEILMIFMKCTSRMIPFTGEKGEKKEINSPQLILLKQGNV